MKGVLSYLNLKRKKVFHTQEKGGEGKQGERTHVSA